MRKGDCPIGTVATIDHPANNTLIVKGEAGWRYVETGEFIDYDDYHKATWDIVTMPSTDTHHAYYLTTEQTENILLCEGHDYKGHILRPMWQVELGP